MLTILGKETAGFCDGLSRRSFLKIGGMALGGLSLPQLLSAEAKAGVGIREAERSARTEVAEGPRIGPEPPLGHR